MENDNAVGRAGITAEVGAGGGSPPPVFI
jgi:hypothetical protein